MTVGRALLVAASAMLAAGCGALGLPEPRAPLAAYSNGQCHEQQGNGTAFAPSAQVSSALMP